MSFDRLAPHYRWLETIAFQNALQNARSCWVDDIPRPERVLIAGEGNGRFLSELLRVHPGINVDCVDASERMLELARARVRRLRPESLGSIRFLHSDIVDWSPSGSYDLIVTHFFLDCFAREQLGAVVAKLAQAAQPDAVWLLADFTVPQENGWMRCHARTWLSAMYLFFRCAANLKANELIDPTPYLEANGFARTSRRVSRSGMLKSEMYVASG